MAENEALREALLELDSLRMREAQALRESDAILAGLERMNAAASPEDALGELLASVCETLGADCACVMEGEGDDLAVQWCAGRLAVDRVTGAAETVLSKPRRVVDLPRTDWWHPLPAPEEGSAPRSWLSVPLTINARRVALVCTNMRADHFTPASQRLLARIARLASQAIAAHALAERNALLAGVIEGSSVALVVADAARADTPLVYVNPAFEAMTGYSRDEVLGTNCRFLSDEPAGSPERERLRHVVEEGGYGRFLLRNRRRNGEVFWNDLTIYPVRGDDGRLRYFAASQVDATDRRIAEKERDEARDRLETALSQIPEGFLLIDDRDRVVLANTQYGGLFPAGCHGWRAGRPFEAAWAGHLVHLGATPERAAVLAAERLAAMRAGPRTLEETVADGRIVQVSERPTADGGCLSVVTDVTRLRESERLLEVRVAAMDCAQDGIAITDPSGSFVYMNPAHRRMFGLSPDADVTGRPWSSLYTPDKAEWLRVHAMGHLSRYGSWRGEVTGRKLDGSPVEQEVALTLLDGGGLICVTRDIAERLRGEAERARLIGQLSAAQRQEAIGVIAAGIAHDLNNIVSVVTGSANLIAESAEVPAAERRHARRIDQAGRSMSDLIHRLLDFAKRAPSRTDVDLSQVLSEAVELLRISVEKNVTLTTDGPAQTLTVPGDPTNVLQVILNLAINARDAIGERQGEITLSARPFAADADDELEDARVVVGTMRAGTAYGVLEVTDTGDGIDPSLFRKIVEPYYSTKGDAGTGLGLSVVAGIVQSMNGFMTIRSAPGTGTTFSVYLPSVTPDPGADAHAEEEAAALAASVNLRGRLVLLCDDDTAEAEMIESVLGRAGAEVASCHHPYDAVHTIQDDPDAWDLVITDFEMPDMSGAGLAAKVREISPRLPILLFTARADWRLQARRGDEELFTREVIKPVEPAALVRAVAGLIGDRAEAEDGPQ